MRVIDSDTGAEEYQRIFRFLQLHQTVLVTWQVNEEGKRQISSTTLGSFQIQTQSISFSFKEMTTLNPSLPVFFYAEDAQFIFKTNSHELKGSQLVTPFPPQIKLIDEDEVDSIQHKVGVDISTTWRTRKLFLEGPEKYSSYMGQKPKRMKERSARDIDFLKDELDMLSLDEEDKMFADKRESVRVRPKGGKIVKLMLKDDPNVHVARLFDLSQGGMAFISHDAEIFPKASEVIIIGFGEFDLDDPLLGTIMSHRPIDDSQNEFKIGIKFNDGQD